MLFHFWLVFLQISSGQSGLHICNRITRTCVLKRQQHRRALQESKAIYLFIYCNEGIRRIWKDGGVHLHVQHRIPGHFHPCHPLDVVHGPRLGNCLHFPPPLLHVWVIDVLPKALKTEWNDALGWRFCHHNNLQGSCVEGAQQPQHKEKGEAATPWCIPQWCFPSFQEFW